MAINADLQQLEPGNCVRLFEVDGTKFGADVLRFHNHTIPYTQAEIEQLQTDGNPIEAGAPYGKPIWWQGVEYGAWPVEVSDLEMSTDGQAATPKITVANLNGLITALCLQFEDMAQAKVIIHDTFSHYLDAANFPAGNAEADPEQEKLQVWYIDRKSSEDDETVEFELASPADLRGQKIPTRQITSLCTWCARGWYRTGNGCDYAGTAYFDKNGNPVSDPSLDVCGGLMPDCKKRYGENNPLSFGGFPGSSLISQ
jgi:lambda family phage minor tail protein L